MKSPGFTLLESLAGVVIVSSVLLAAGPPIILNISNRAQNQRAEQAGQIVTAEVERIRTQVLEGKYTTADLPAVATLISGDITSAPAPTTLANKLRSNNTCNTDSGTPLPADQVLSVDLDGSCHPQFLVQIFRDPGLVVPGTKPVVMMFRLGVRVYSAQAIQSGTLALLSPASCARLQFSNGLGEQQNRPLAVAYTAIVRSEVNSWSMEKYKDYIALPVSPPTILPCS